MDDLDFLAAEECSDANATLTVQLPDCSVEHIHNLSPFKLLDKCPLLYHAFEYTERGNIQQGSIEASSLAAVKYLLRYLYTGDYLSPEEQHGKTSLLTHVEIYMMAEVFDIPELQVAANFNFLRETETACSLPVPPKDLCKAIRFVYKHYANEQSSQQHSLRDTLLNFCISTFQYHKLGAMSEFVETVFDIPEFHQDLCRTSMVRNFQDEGAADILRLESRSSPPCSGANLNKRALGDFLHEFFSDPEESLDIDNDCVGETHSKRRKSDIGGTFEVVHRPRQPQDMSTNTENDSSSEEDSGFTLVRRPKLNVECLVVPRPAVDDTPSSPAPDSGVIHDASQLSSIKTSPNVVANDEWSPVSDDDSSWSIIDLETTQS